MNGTKIAFYNGFLDEVNAQYGQAVLAILEEIAMVLSNFILLLENVTR